MTFAQARAPARKAPMLVEMPQSRMVSMPQLARTAAQKALP